MISLSSYFFISGFNPSMNICTMIKFAVSMAIFSPQCFLSACLFSSVIHMTAAICSLFSSSELLIAALATVLQ
jgi:hypothetical protein